MGEGIIIKMIAVMIAAISSEETATSNEGMGISQEEEEEEGAGTRAIVEVIKEVASTIEVAPMMEAIEDEIRHGGGAIVTVNAGSTTKSPCQRT